MSNKLLRSAGDGEYILQYTGAQIEEAVAKILSFMIGDSKNNSVVISLGDETFEVVKKDYIDNSFTSINQSLNSKQQQLESGSNIKTINNESLLGAGNISIDGAWSNALRYEEVE